MSLKSFDINICKGCESLYSDMNPNTLNCQMAPEHNGIQCPCINCLVKMRCRDSECDMFQNYRKNLPIKYLYIRKE